MSFVSLFFLSKYIVLNVGEKTISYNGRGGISFKTAIVSRNWFGLEATDSMGGKIKCPFFMFKKEDIDHLERMILLRSNHPNKAK